MESIFAGSSNVTGTAATALWLAKHGKLPDQCLLNEKPDIRNIDINQSFLASGGDQFTMFTQGEDDVGGVLDVDALEAYLHAHSPVSPPATDRITRIH